MENPAVNRSEAGDPIPSKCAVIEVHVAELKQLFNAIDPSPFRQRDLDPDAEDFIVGWAARFQLTRHSRSSSISIARLAFLRSPPFCGTRFVSSSASVLRCRGDAFGSCFDEGASVS